MEKQKIDFNDLYDGYGFSPTTFTLNDTLVKAYIQAVEEQSTLYRDSKLVPPMAIVALAMAELSQSVVFPNGAIHVSQEVNFMKAAHIGDIVTSQAKVIRKQKRGPLHMLTIEFRAVDADSKEVMTGKTEFILPVSGI